jgi:hypothetical protein
VRSRTALKPLSTYPVYDFSTKQFWWACGRCAGSRSAPAVPSWLSRNRNRLAQGTQVFEMKDCPVCVAWINSKKVVQFLSEPNKKEKEAHSALLASICAAIRKDDEAGKWFRFCNDSIDLRFEGLSYLLAFRMWPDGGAPKAEYEKMIDEAHRFFSTIVAHDRGTTPEGLLAHFHGHIH